MIGFKRTCIFFSDIPYAFVWRSLFYFIYISVNLWYLNKPDEDWYWPVKMSQLNSISRCLISPCKSLLDCNVFNLIYFDWSRSFCWLQGYTNVPLTTPTPNSAVAALGRASWRTGQSRNSTVASIFSFTNNPDSEFHGHWKTVTLSSISPNVSKH